MKVFLKGLFVSFLIFLPVSVFLALVFIVTISALSFFVTNDDVQRTIDILWGVYGAWYAYLVAFLGTMFYQYGAMILRKEKPSL